MVSLVDGCRVAIPLDSIEASHDLAIMPGCPPTPLEHEGDRVPVVDWCEVTGITRDPSVTRRHALVVRTPVGPIGLGVDAPLGIRTLSLAAGPPVATTLRAAAGEPLCFLVLLEGHTYFLLDPRALQQAAAEESRSDLPNGGAQGH
jgi:hypothetical protein